MSDPVIPVKDKVLRFERKLTVNERLRESLSQREEVLNIASRNAEAACRNEQLTRQRVESLERGLQWFFSMSLRARLHWVLFGFPPIQKPTQPAIPSPEESEPQVEEGAQNVH